MNSFEQMEAVIAQRRAEPQEGSYTCYLFEKGIDKILKKVGEECAETIIAAKNGDKAELVGEINDVFYHMMVMMNECGVTLDDVCKEMDIRAQKIGNLKKFHVSFFVMRRPALRGRASAFPPCRRWRAGRQAPVSGFHSRSGR